MNKNENVILDWSGDGGIANTAVLSQKTPPIEQVDRCDYFDDAFGRNDEKVRSKIAEIEANNRLMESLKKQIEELDERIDTAKRKNAQLQAEIQEMKADAGRKSALAVHEKHVFACWCFESRYSLTSFCKLYLRCLPCDELPQAFYGSFRRMMVSLNGYLAEDKNGMTLCGYRGDDLRAFPIDAYRVACRRLGKRVDFPVFTLRERYSLEAIERAYRELPEVALGREREDSRLKLEERKSARPKKRRLEEREDVELIVGSVFREMPHATEDEKNYEISKRAHISIDQAKRWKKAYRSNHPKQPLN